MSSNGKRASERSPYMAKNSWAMEKSLQQVVPSALLLTKLIFVRFVLHSWSRLLTGCFTVPPPTGQLFFVKYRYPVRSEKPAFLLMAEIKQLNRKAIQRGTWGRQHIVTKETCWQGGLCAMHAPYHLIPQNDAASSPHRSGQLKGLRHFLCQATQTTSHLSPCWTSYHHLPPHTQYTCI